MTEWGVVGVIIALVGFVVALGTPIIKLVSTLTKLTTIVDTLQGGVVSLTDKNTEAHGRLWAKNEEQDKTISNHEGRISKVEGKIK